MSVAAVLDADDYADLMSAATIIAAAEGLGFTGHSDDLGLTFRDAARFVIAAAERDGFEALHGYGPGRYEAWALDCATAASAYIDAQSRPDVDVDPRDALEPHSVQDLTDEGVGL